MLLIQVFITIDTLLLLMTVLFVFVIPIIQMKMTICNPQVKCPYLTFDIQLFDIQYSWLLCYCQYSWPIFDILLMTYDDDIVPDTGIRWWWYSMMILMIFWLRWLIIVCGKYSDIEMTNDIVFRWLTSIIYYSMTIQYWNTFNLDTVLCSIIQCRVLLFSDIVIHYSILFIQLLMTIRWYIIVSNDIPDWYCQIFLFLIFSICYWWYSIYWPLFDGIYSYLCCVVHSWYSSA